MSAAPFGDVLAAEADRLDALAEETGDARARIAAGVLRGRTPGRPAHDDAEALSLARALFAAGLKRSRRAACFDAAMLYGGGNSVEATARRLQRKWSETN